MDYPKDILGNKVMEDIYTLAVKARSKMEVILERNLVLEAELSTLKQDYEAKKLEIDAIKIDVTKAKTDIQELKPKG